MTLRSKIGKILLTAYSTIFLCTVGLNFYELIFRTADSALSSVPALVVTSPWSIALMPLWVASGYIDWYNRFAGTPFLLGFFATLTLLPGATLNAVIAYWIGKLFVRHPRGVRS